MKSRVGPLEPGGVRRLSVSSVCNHFYVFLVTLCILLLEPLLRMLVFLANKYHFGQKLLSRDKGRVKAKDLVTGRFLGQGCSGIFYETVWTRWLPGSMARLARKDFPGVKGDIFESEVVRLFELREHPNVMKTLCWTVDNRSCSLVMEYMKDNLSSFVRRKKEALMNEPVAGTSLPPFDLLEAMDIALQIATGVEYLHEEGIPHGDLKPNNVLIDWKEGRMVVKVADFGLIETKRRTTLISQRALCFRMVEWSAPEVLEDYFASIGEDLDYIWTPSSTKDMTGIPSASDCDEKVMMELADSYSFALTCTYILGGKIWNTDRLRKRMPRSGCRPELPSECPENLGSLISKCWDANPKRRPTFTDICHELQEIVKEQRKQEEQLKMRNMMLSIIKEQREQEVLRQQETLSNTLQIFVKEKEKLQEGMLDIRNAMQDSRKDIMDQLRNFCIQLQDIAKVVQDFTADSNPLKPMELPRLNSPTPEALSADSGKISCLDPDPAILEQRKGKALVSEYSETKECITCTREREGFDDLNDQTQTDSERPDDVGPSDQFRIARESKHEEVNVSSLTRTTETSIPRPENWQSENDLDVDENPSSCIEVVTSLSSKLHKHLFCDLSNVLKSILESYQYPSYKQHSPYLSVKMVNDIQKRSNCDELKLGKSLLGPWSFITVTSRKHMLEHPIYIVKLEFRTRVDHRKCGSHETVRDSFVQMKKLRSSQNLLKHKFLLSSMSLPEEMRISTILGELQLQELPNIGRLPLLNSLRSRKALRIPSLDQLINLQIFVSLPKSMSLSDMRILTNLKALHLHDCDQIRELSDSIEQLKVPRSLYLRSWSSLEALPYSLGQLRNLRCLQIEECIPKLSWSIVQDKDLSNLEDDRQT